MKEAFDNIRQLAENDVYVREILKLYDDDEISREDALISMVMFIKSQSNIYQLNLEIFKQMYPKGNPGRFIGFGEDQSDPPNPPSYPEIQKHLQPMEENNNVVQLFKTK